MKEKIFENFLFTVMKAWFGLFLLFGKIFFLTNCPFKNNLQPNEFPF